MLELDKFVQWNRQPFIGKGVNADVFQVWMRWVCQEGGQEAGQEGEEVSRFSPDS